MRLCGHERTKTRLNSNKLTLRRRSYILPKSVTIGSGLSTDFVVTYSTMEANNSVEVSVYRLRLENSRQIITKEQDNRQPVPTDI